MADRILPITSTRLAHGLIVGPALLAVCPAAWAGPEGQRVVAGSASFARNGPVTTITASNNTIINYTGFNIGAHETVRFVQPDASSRVLNRISGAAPTIIDGSLLSNGIVYIVNPAGVVFSEGSIINVGGLHAAAASITNADFLGGIERFTDARGAVVNEGTIVAPEVMLFGRAVRNSGSVISPNGVVAFVAGEDLYLGERGGRMYLRVDGAASPQAGGVTNLGRVEAPGGKVMVGAGDMFGVALHASSRIAAREVSVRAGRGSVASVSGVIDASTNAPGTTGGSIDIRSDHVGLFGATLDASGASGGGDIRVGGDFHGAGGPRAQKTYVSDDSTIRADATRAGDGGSVVVWSDQVTRFAGTISARGGPMGGHGGVAEVSGKETLFYRGFTDLRAVMGERGSLLLDPKNIVIATGGADPIAGNEAFADAPADTRTFSPADVVTALDGANLTLQANNDITISDPIDASANAGSGDLTLQAGRSIAIDADVTLRGSFTATANDTDASLVGAQRDPGPATISMAPGTTIDTSATGGNIQLRVLEGGAADTSASSMTIASLNAGSGHVLARYAGPTSGQGIQRADASSLITASSAAFATNGSGGSGFLGTSAAPIRLSVDNLEAVAQRNGAFFTNDKSITVGGAALGGLSGISVVSTAVAGDLSLEADGAMSVTEPITVARDANLSATDGVTLASSVATNTTLTGSSSINADADGDNNTGGTPDPLTLGPAGSITTNGNPLSLTVGDLSINPAASINAGVGTLGISGSAGAGTIGVGGGLAGDAVSISQAELQRLTASSLTIGSATTTTLRVGTVVETDLAGISSTTNLASDDMTFVSASEFPTLNARATDSISVLAPITTTVGTLLLQGDSDSSGAGSNDITIAGGIALYSVGDLHVLASGGISLPGGVGTTNTFTGGAITLADIASAAADVRIQSGGNINAAEVSIGIGDLLVELDTGNLGVFQADFDAIDANLVNVFAGVNDTLRLNGAVTTAAAAGVDIDAGGVEFNAPVTANGSGVVRVTNSGSLSIADGADVFAGGGFTQDGAGAILLGADISTPGTPVVLGRPVTLLNTVGDLVTIDTTIGAPAGANITFSFSTNGSVVGGQSLTLNAGTGGDIRFNTGVGAIARLNALRILNARDVTAAAGLQAVSLTQVAGQRLTTFSGPVIAFGGGIDLNGNEFVFANNINSASGGLIQITNSGPLTFGAAFTVIATGGLLQDGAGPVALGLNVNTSGDQVTITGPVTLRDTAADLFTIDTTTSGFAAGGNVRFLSTINGTNAGGQSLTLNAGTGGNLSFEQDLGAATRLGTLTITNARDLVASGVVTTGAIRQVAGQGLTRFDGAVSANGSGGIDLDALTSVPFTFNSSVNASAGSFSLSGGAATFADALGANGSIEIVSSGAVQVVGATTASTGSLSVNAGPTSFGGAVNAATSVAVTSTGSTTFSSDVTAGTGSITLDAGSTSVTGAVNAATFVDVTTTGAATFSSDVTAGTGSITLDADSASVTGAVNAGSSVDVTTTGAATFSSDVTASAGGITLDAGSTSVTGAVNAATSVDVTTTGTATFGSAVTAGTGNINLTASSASVAGAATAANGAIDINAATILLGGNATAGSGGVRATGTSVTFNGTVSSGSGGVDIAGTTVNFADDVTTTSGGRVDITNNGLLTIADGATIIADGGFVQDGPGAVALGASITTTGDAISFLGPVTLSDTASDLVTLNTTSGANPAGANVSFGSTLTGAVASTQALTINAGTGADAIFSGAVGATRLGVLTITNARDLIALSSLAAASINQSAGQRLSRFDGPVTTASTGAVSLTGQAVTFNSTLVAGSGGLTINGAATSFAGGVTAGAAGVLINATSITFDDAVTAGAGGITLTGTAVTFGNDVTVSGPGAVTVTNSGTLTIDDGAPVSAPGGFTQNGTGPVSLGANIRTTGTPISFARSVTLIDTASDLVTLSTTDGGAASGASIAFASTLNAGSPEAQSLTLDAGTSGDATFAGVVGATRLGTLTITNARDAIASSAVSASTIRQIAGQRLTRFGAAVSTTGVGGIDLTGSAFEFNGTLSAGAAPLLISGADVTLASTATAGTISINGAALLFGGSLTSTGADSSYSGTTISFADDVSSAGTLSITNSGTLTVPAAAPLTAVGAFTQSGPGAVSLGAPVSAASLSFAGPTTLTAPISLNGPGGVAFGSTLGVGGNNLTIISDGVVSFGAPVTGGGASLLLEPTLGSTPIDLGTIAGGSLPGTLSLTAASLSRLDGFSTITVGRDPSGASHVIRIGTSTFNDPVSIRSGSTGSIAVSDGGLTGAGDATILLTGPTTLASTISNTGRNITIDGQVVVGQSASAVVTTGVGGGNILVTGDITGTSGPGTEALALTAGTGTITVLGDISGLSGSADPLGLSNLTFGSASGVNLQSVTIAGTLITGSTLTGPFIAAGPVSVGSINVSGTTFTFSAGLFATGSVSINNSGLLTLLGGLSTNGSIDITGPALLSGAFSSTNNPITLGGAVTLADDSAFRAGTSTFTLGPAGSIATAGHDLELTADDIAIAAAPGSITSAGSGGALLIQPASDTRAIALASPSINPSGGFLDLSSAEVAAIDAGFDSLTVGRADGRHEIRVGTLAVADPFTLRTPLGGSIFVGNGGITGSGNASILLDGSGATTTIAANITTDGDHITISDAVLVGADATLSTGDASGGNIHILGSIDQVPTAAPGTFSLTTRAGLGSVALDSPVGAIRALGSLTVAGSDATLASVGTSAAPGLTGPLTINAASTLTLAGDAYRAASIQSTAGAIRVASPLTTMRADSGAISFSGPVTLQSGADLDARAATSLSFDSAINATAGGAPETLSLQAGTSATLAGPVGNTAPLHAFTLAASTASLNAVTTITSQTLSAPSGLTLAANLASSGSGDIAITGPVTLAAPVTIVSAGAVGDDISVGGTVNGTHAISLNAGAGNLSLAGVIGGTTPLDALTAAAANILIDAIGAAGPGVNGLTSIVGSTSITFTGSLYRANGQTYAAPTKSFTSGNVRFLSTSDPISITGGTTTLAAGPLLDIQTLGADITLDTLAGSMASKSITLDAGVGTLAIGGVAPAGSTRGTLLFTADEIDITGPVSGASIVLQPATPSLGIRVASGAGGTPLNLTATEMGFLQNGFSSITIGREADGAHEIIVGTLTFRDPLRLLASSGGSIQTGLLTGLDDASLFINGTLPARVSSITMSGGSITIDDDVLLSLTSTFNTQGGPGLFPGGNVSITGAIDGPGGLGGLNILAGTGQVTLGGPIGAADRLLHLDITGSRITLPGAHTINHHRYAGPVVVTGSSPTFTSLPGVNGNILFRETIDGPGALTINAGNVITFGANVGAGTTPASLEATGTAIRFANSLVRTVGSQQFNGPALSFDLGSGTPTSLTFATGAGASSSINFSSTFDGPGAVVLDAGAGSIAMGGVFGNSTPLTSLDVTGASITSAGATSSGAQVYRGPVTLGAPSSTFNASSIRFASTINGAGQTTLRAPGGDIRFEAPIGQTTHLLSIDAQASTILLPSVRTRDAQRFMGQVTLAPGDVVLRTSGGPGDSVTLGSINGASNLEINSGVNGDVVLTADAGALTPLGVFNIVHANNVTTQAVNASTILLGTGNGHATFNGRLTATGGPDGIFLNARSLDILGGMTATSAGIQINNLDLLRIPATSTISLAGPFTQGNGGPVQLGASIDTPTRAVTFSGPVSLTSDVSVRGSSIAMSDPINSLGTPRSLTLASSGPITTRSIGVSSPLANLSILNAGAATASLNGSIAADGAVVIEPPLRLVTDTSITGLGGIRFGSTVDSATATPVALTLQVQTASAALPSDPAAIPIVEFGADVGQVNRLGSLRINPAERDAVPEIATIVSRGPLSVDAGALFEVGRGDKITTIGDVTLVADRILLGDVSAFGDIFVQSPDITILTRPGGNILGPASIATDQGADLVALDRIEFSSTPAIDGDGLVFLATQGGAGFSDTLASIPQRAFGTIGSDLFFRGTTVLDLRAQGPTNTNVSESIAGASPRESQSGNVRRNTSIGAAQEEELRKIGIDPRSLDLKSLIETLIGRSIYNDLEASADGTPRNLVTEGRLTQSIVASTLQTAREVLGDADSDRRRELKARIALAAEMYMEKEDTAQVEDGQAFRALIDSEPALEGARSELAGLARLFQQLRLLGLTDFELGQAWRVISDDIRPDGVSSEVLRAVIEPGYTPRPRRRGIFDTGESPTVEPPDRIEDTNPSEPVIGLLPVPTPVAARSR